MPVIPGSLAPLLSLLRPAFTAPTFETFCALVVGFVGRVSEHTVTGMWQAARLAGVVHHSRGHDFFARARWSADELGLLLLDFLVSAFVPPEGPIRLALDDTLFCRSGARVFGALFHQDPHAEGGPRIRFGNNWVSLGLLVRLPFMQRTVCLPLLFRLFRPGERRPSRPQLGRELAELVLRRFPARELELDADAAYASRAFRDLPSRASVRMRLRRDAALYRPPPERTGKRGRPRRKGERMPSLRELADAPKAAWREAEVTRHAKTASVRVLTLDCLWYSVFGCQPVRVVVLRERGRADGFDIALLTTAVQHEAADIVARYAERWAIEVSFQDAKQVMGVGEARNRTEAAVLRTVPFGFLCLTLTICWYALWGEAHHDVARRRRLAPWYSQKRTPSFADMLIALRRSIIREQFRPGPPAWHTPPELFPPAHLPSSQAA
jgi:hypothetical protein